MFKKKEKKKKEKKAKVKTQEEQLQEVEKEIQAMLEDMQVITGSSTPEVRVLTMGPKEKKKLLIFRIIETIISILLMFAAIGFFSFIEAKSIFKIIEFVFIFITIEVIMNLIISRFFLKYVIYSFGLITILPTIIGMVVSLVIPLGIEVNDYLSLIIATLLYFICKKVFMIFIKGNFGYLKKIK